MEYDACTANDVDDLVECVREMVDLGWRPLGGIACAAVGSGVDTEMVWAQAVTKEAPAGKRIED